MKALWKYRPDLRACELEERLVPAIPALGAIVQTTGGYVLPLSAVPVIFSQPFGPFGGPPFLVPPFLMGSAGSSGSQPGNSTGVAGPGTTAPTGSNGGAAVTIVVGSGANDVSGAAGIQPVTRNTIANDELNTAPDIRYVSGNQSAVLPPEQVYRGGVPVPAAAGDSAEPPRQRVVQEPAQEPVDPLPLRIRKRPHRLASGASGTVIRPHADRAP